MEILRAYGVPVEIVDAINMMHTNTTPQVLSLDGDTEFFEILAGVLQWDTLAPYLFITAFDYAMRQAVGNESNLRFTLDRSRSRRHSAKVVCDSDFADDIAPLSNTLEQAHLLLSRVKTPVKQTGLHINNSKTEYIKFYQDERDLKALKDESLKDVDDLLYLGSCIDCCSKDVNVSIKRCGLHFINLIQFGNRSFLVVWRLDFSGQRLKRSSCTDRRLGHWHSLLTKKLDRAYIQMLRVVKNVTWQQRITNEGLYGGLPRISSTTWERRLWFSGHCWRSKNEVVSDLVLWEPKHSKRSVGGHARTFASLLEADIGVPRDCLLASMGDRVGWRKRPMGVDWGRPSSSSLSVCLSFSPSRSSLPLRISLSHSLSFSLPPSLPYPLYLSAHASVMRCNGVIS